MEPHPPFFSLGEHFGMDLPGARALFTTRRGGRSQGPYASLNLGLFTDDDPDDVRANQETVAAIVGRPLARCRQVHGTTIWEADHDSATTSMAQADHDSATTPMAQADHDSATTPVPEADGLLCTRPDRAPMVLVADCLPVVIAAPGAVAVLHAGWRGLAGGILSEGVARVRAATPDGPLAAAVGPGAGGCCYEVG